MDRMQLLKCWLPSHQQSRAKLLFQRGCHVWCIHEMMWSDKLARVHPSSMVETFLLLLSRQHWFAELRITLWMRAVVLSYTASVWGISVPIVTLGEKMLLTQAGVQYGWRGPGLEKGKRGNRANFNMKICRIKPSTHRNCHIIQWS